MSSVLLPWVEAAPWKCQSILQSGFRGPDDKNPPAVKAVNRWIRAMSQNNADPSKPYMRPDDLPSPHALCDELEFMTCHYVHHLADSLRVIAIWHHDEWVKYRAWQYHWWIADELFHFVPETMEEFMKRHQDKVEHA